MKRELIVSGARSSWPNEAIKMRVFVELVTQAEVHRQRRRV